MANRFKFKEIIVFLYLIFFPFGQLFSVSLTFLSLPFSLHLIDLIPLVSLVIFFLEKVEKPRVFKYFASFLIILFFSLILSTFTFGPNIWLGFFYFLRLISYVAFFVMGWNLVNEALKLKYKFFDGLILVSFFAGIFGWVQYLFFPDLRALYYIGWDDHLYRLVGTFLDPAFTGIILAFGFLATLSKFLSTGRKKIIVLMVFFLISIAFTYSRASYLALLTGVTLISVYRKRPSIILTIGAVLTFFVILLPRPAGEGVKLERTSSVYPRIQNYTDSLTLIKKFPLFGVGFNNICQAKQKFLGPSNIYSHSCSGLDSSLLFLLATAGIVGFISFLNLIINLGKNLEENFLGETVKSSFLALLVHSSFSNSIFYAWVMGWFAILLAISLKEKT